jgi:hypothetical protein
MSLLLSPPSSPGESQALSMSSLDVDPLEVDPEIDSEIEGENVEGGDDEVVEGVAADMEQG